MLKRKVKLVASGIYLPKREVPSEEIDRKIGKPLGTIEKTCGVRSRRYADPINESSSWMGAQAVNQALQSAGLKFEDLDAVISSSGTLQQMIPSTASLVLKEMGKLEAGIPAFDISTTCLSFVSALDTASVLVEAGRFKRVVLVSSEIASVGIDYGHLESAGLFGDGAAAWIVEKATDSDSSVVLGSRMETYPSGSEHCQIIGGGSKYHPREWATKENQNQHLYLFSMDGRKAFRMAAETVPGFLDKLLTESSKIEGRALKLSDVSMIVPHQASGSGMALMKRRLDVSDGRWMDILSNHGNMISASIPLALHYATREGKIKRGDLILLMGTSAGFAVGGIVMRY